MIKKKPRKVAPNPYLNAASPDDLGPTDRIAFDIIADRPDLLPSVDRIMTAGLDTAAAHRAISLFRDSLESGSDPNRDPRVAIVNSAAHSDNARVTRTPFGLAERPGRLGYPPRLAKRREEQR